MAPSSVSVPRSPFQATGAFADPLLLASLQNPLRRMMFFWGLALIFVRFSMLHQIVTFKLQTNIYMLYWVGIPALIGVLITGGLPRVFRFRTTFYWCCFAVWLFLAVPFSLWQGGSAGLAATYVRTDFVMLFVTGGLAVGWRDCRLIFKVIAAACVLNLLTSQIFGQVDANERVSLQFGTISNSNDFAGHLILVLPFLLWMVFSASWVITRILSGVGVAYGVYLVLASGSRGAAVALVIATIFAIFAAPSRVRLLMLLAAPVLVIVAGLALPTRTLQRILSFSEKSLTASAEAMESSRVREKLLKDSIMHTLQNPLFGVGPGQFSLSEGQNTKNEAGPGLWYQTHNSFTQISSECGIPALLFYLGGTVSTWLLFRRAYRQVLPYPQLKEMTTALFCVRLGYLAYCVAILFLNFAYFYYLPAMAGLAMVLSSAASLAIHKIGVGVAGSTPLPRPDMIPVATFNPTPSPQPSKKWRFRGQARDHS